MAYDVAGIRIAGEYQGRLDNGADRIALIFSDSLTIQEFVYQDSWYPETDGGGSSLEIVDPLGPLDAWEIAEGWRPSAAPGGSPGRAAGGEPAMGGLRRPGDFDGDGRLRFGDGVDVLRALFIDPSPPAPCGGGVGEGGNLFLLDVNGDGQVSVGDVVRVLAYIFLDGAPPVLGTSCVPIAGCADSCR
jgi:hypothetical protein